MIDDGTYIIGWNVKYIELVIGNNIARKKILVDVQRTIESVVKFVGFSQSGFLELDGAVLSEDDLKKTFAEFYGDQPPRQAYLIQILKCGSSGGDYEFAIKNAVVGRYDSSNGNVIDFIKEIYFKDDLVMSELIRRYARYLTREEIQELLDWSGDSEFVTVDDVLE